MADTVLVDLPYMESACFFPSLESLLRYCTTSFLAAFSTGSDLNITKLRSISSRVVNAYQDPPLEAVWFFSALTFHVIPNDLRYIIQLLSAFTTSSATAAKPLALLAPVVSELFHSAKPRTKVESLVEAVLRSISICSSRPAGDEAKADEEVLLPVFGELVKVWTVRNLKGRCPFQVLFPLVRDEARQELMKEGCSVTFLAGVVAAEAFLLGLCLKVKAAEGVPRS